MGLQGNSHGGPEEKYDFPMDQGEGGHSGQTKKKMWVSRPFLYLLPWSSQKLQVAWEPTPRCSSAVHFVIGAGTFLCCERVFQVLRGGRGGGMRGRGTGWTWTCVVGTGQSLRPATTPIKLMLFIGNSPKQAKDGVGHHRPDQAWEAGLWSQEQLSLG